MMFKKRMLVVFMIILLFPLCAYSLPTFMEIFNKDPFAKKSKKNNCGVCHVSPSGGGPRNEFGQAFDKNGHKIDQGLREQFPKLFDLFQSITPRIKRVKPRKIKVGVETTLKIKGKNFAEDSTILVDGQDIAEIEGAVFTFINQKKATLTITFSEPGKHTIQIQNTTGQSSNLFKVKVKVPKN